MCGPRALDSEDRYAVTNPTVIVEVLSRSTEEYDRGDKFEHYKRLLSLREYVLVSHRTREVEIWTRAEGEAWFQRIYRDGERALIAAIDATRYVRELYDAAAEPSS